MANTAEGTVQIAGAGTNPDSNKQLYDDWAQKYEEDVRKWGYEMPEVVAAKLKKYTPSGTEATFKVLDAGAGDGLSGKAIVNEGFKDVIGIDISPELVKIANKHKIYKLAEVADLSKPLKYGADQFDAITVVGVMTYLEPDGCSLEEFCRVVKPGGLVLMTHRTDKVDRWLPRQLELEKEGRWEKVEITEPLPYLPKNPEFGDKIKVQVHIYRVCKKENVDMRVTSKKGTNAPTAWIYVTGCDSGFGSLVVKDLAERNFGVFATHLNDESANTLRAAHPNIVPLKVDITKDDSVNAAAAQIKEKLGQDPRATLFGLINNAGLLLQNGPVEWTPAKNFEIMFQVNVVGAVRVTNSVLPLLRRSQGRIVNVASIAGRFGIPLQSAYCASKHAMEGYSDCLRREVMDWGITVHIIEPGVFNKTGLYATFTDGVRKLWDGISPEVQAAYGEKFRDSLGETSKTTLNKYSNSDTTLVPKAMVDALTSPRPQYRYQVGVDSKIMVPFFKWCHEAWQDFFFKLEKPPSAAGMDPKAGARALARYDNGGLLRKISTILILFYLLPNRARRRIGF